MTVDPRPAAFFDRPVLRYVGSKWKIGKWIASQFPPHTVYVEPFAGSCAMFLRKPPSPVEILNDLDGDVVNFFDQLRNNTEALLRAIRYTPYSRAEWLRSFDVSRSGLERARRFYVRCWQSFGGNDYRITGWRSSTDPAHRMASGFARMDGLEFAAAAMLRVQWQCAPATEIIEKYDSPETLFYMDPPYLMKTRSQGRSRRRYVHEMNDHDHKALAEALTNIRGMAVLSGYDSAEYRSLFVGWDMVSKSATTNNNGSSTECLWLHPNNSRAQLRLF